MSLLTLHLKTWRDARTLANDLTDWIFRGQQDASWQLITSLQRGALPAFLPKREEQIIEVFQRRAHHFVPVPPGLHERMEWMAMIQHYGGPTRLLDFTRSFYIAAFFALEKATSQCSAIWCVNSDKMLEKAVEKLKKAVEKNLVNFEDTQKALDMLADMRTQPFWQRGLVVEKIINQNWKIINQTWEVVFEIQPFRLNERLAIQQGRFLCPVSVEIPFANSLAQTLGGSRSALSEETPEQYQSHVHTQLKLNELGIFKVVLPPEIRDKAVQDLWNMNITASTLFPGLDGFARSLHYFLLGNGSFPRS